MRRARSALVALAAGGVLAVSACSSAGDGAKPANTGGSTTGTTTAASNCETANKKLNLAFVYATTSQNPFQEMAMGAQAAANEDGNVDLTLAAPSSIDGAAEVQLLTAVAKKATDGIAWQSVTPDLFLRELQNIKSAKIPLVAVDNMTPEGVEPDLVVSNSNTGLGKDLGEAFVKQNPESNGEVVLILDIPSLGLLKQRIEGVTAAIKEKLPNMKISGPFDGKSNNGIAGNLAAIQSMINSHAKSVGFIGVGDLDGINLTLIKGRTGAKWHAGSADIPPQALEGVKSGALFALASTEHWMKGYIAINQIIKSKRTCKAMPTGWWDSGNLLVDTSNVDAIIARQKDEKSRTEWFLKNPVPAQLANPPLKAFSELS